MTDRYPLPVRAGIVCRAEDRGLGVLTHDAYRALDFDRAAVINYEVRDDRFPLNLDRFPDATLLTCDMHNGRRLDEDECRDWLRGLDVVYLAETAYDWRFLGWARDEGVATIIHGMPEYTPHARGDDLPNPDVWWWPTPWRLQYLPVGPVVSIPAPLDAPPETATPYAAGDELVIHHVAGHRSAHDRNGTSEVIRAIRYLRSGITVRMFTQDGRLPPTAPPAGVNVDVVARSVPDRFDLFAGAHLLWMPRRYGGLCLPVQEAMTVGVPAVMPEISANDFWPTLRFPINADPYPVRMLGGTVAFAPIDFREMARFVNDLSPDDINDAQTAAVEWAEANSWDALAPEWARRIGEAASRTSGSPRLAEVPETGNDSTEVPPPGPVATPPARPKKRPPRRR